MRSISDYPYQITAKDWFGRTTVVAEAREHDVAKAAFEAACLAYAENEVSWCWGAICKRTRDAPPRISRIPAPIRAEMILDGTWH